MIKGNMPKGNGKDAATAPVKFFWKDRERRFAGVSNAFLQYYGLSSSDKVYGKTDEEMQWHIDDQRSSDREEEVINKGKAVFNCPQKCIIGGRVHNFFISKMPLYHNGNIQGLIGCFFDSEEFVKRNRRGRIVNPAPLLYECLGLSMALIYFILQCKGLCRLFQCMQHFLHLCPNAQHHCLLLL